MSEPASGERSVRVKEEPEWMAGRGPGEQREPERGAVEVQPVKETGETGGRRHSFHIKEEVEWTPESETPEGDEEQGLYSEHLVEVEIMLSPEELQPPDSPSIQPNCGSPQGANKQAKTSQQKKTSKHGKKPSKNNIYACDMCMKIFKHKRYLRIHTRIHTGVKPYSCDLCTRQFTQKNTLTSHRRSHTGEKPYCCELCPKQFARRYNLVAHTRTHTGDRPYSCEVCSKRFLQPHHLAKHKRSHTGEKPFTCEVCERPFNTKHQVNSHMRTHTGDKPFTCEVCLKNFTQKNTLVVHRRIHTGEKPYACQLCPKRFSNRKSFSVHMKTHNRHARGKN